MSKIQVILLIIITIIIMLAIFNLILSIINMKLEKYKK